MKVKIQGHMRKVRVTTDTTKPWQVVIPKQARRWSKRSVVRWLRSLTKH